MTGQDLRDAAHNFLTDARYMAMGDEDIKYDPRKFMECCQIAQTLVDMAESRDCGDAQCFARHWEILDKFRVAETGLRFSIDEFCMKFKNHYPHIYNRGQ